MTLSLFCYFLLFAGCKDLLSDCASLIESPSQCQSAKVFFTKYCPRTCGLCGRQLFVLRASKRQSTQVSLFYKFKKLSAVMKDNVTEVKYFYEGVNSMMTLIFGGFHCFVCLSCIFSSTEYRFCLLLFGETDFFPFFVINLHKIASRNRDPRTCPVEVAGAVFTNEALKLPFSFITFFIFPGCDDILPDCLTYITNVNQCQSSPFFAKYCRKSCSFCGR